MTISIALDLTDAQAALLDMLVARANADAQAAYDAAKTYATGKATATGVDGTTIPAGAQLQRADGAAYRTDTPATIAGGVATLGVIAVVAGSAGNAVAGTTLAFAPALAGVDGSAAVGNEGLAGGSEPVAPVAETRETFLGRHARRATLDEMDARRNTLRADNIAVVLNAFDAPATTATQRAAALDAIGLEMVYGKIGRKT